MGRTLKNLAKKSLQTKPVFNNRFVVEVCERMHVHYRNLRLNLSLEDFIKLSEGFTNSLERWNKRGRPECGPETHIELCRKNVATNDSSDDIQINLNKNLYKDNEGRIFSEGADIKDEIYIHLKLRDIRVELSINEFLILADAFKQADKRFKSLDIGSLLQKA